MEHISFKSGCVVRVVKHLKVDWLIVLHLQLWLKITFYRFTVSVLKKSEIRTVYSRFGDKV